ncbi:MAG: FAD-binding protein [Pusillimonas sp.]|mgnify:FL=1|jgi:hypothetical protein|nr:FAD-binding protein [Pusillimonas sp.]MBC43787.1 FAD-binding protein [Pusillimonas sp.]|tara:strand:- start:29528 stop:30445 length:918 start_codon:yes stop_codon:yes gene_type:complete
MPSLSRRAFFTGRRITNDPWENFCQRMRRLVQGSFFNEGRVDGFGHARLSAKTPADVHHALMLCKEYEVVLLLDGLEQEAHQPGASVLWLDPSIYLKTCQPVPDTDDKWFVQPGCFVAELKQAGLTQFEAFPDYLTVAALIADRVHMNLPTGELWRMGLSHAGVLLADETTAVLGPFGVGQRQPLGTLTVQQLVPALFRLCAGDSARLCAESSHWPGRYRLDALMPANEHDVNLSHLLFGQGSDLCWAEWFVFQAMSEPVEPQPFRGVASGAFDETVVYAAQDIDLHIKNQFDPCGIFPHPGQAL